MSYSICKFCGSKIQDVHNSKVYAISYDESVMEVFPGVKDTRIPKYIELKKSKRGGSVSIGVPLNGGDYKSSRYCSDIFNIIVTKCPFCNKQMIYFNGVGNDIKDIKMDIYPRVIKFNRIESVPKDIYESLEEAIIVSKDSPKASAVLSRRCLELLLEDFYEIKERTLAASISLLERKKEVDLDVIDSLKGLKDKGNVGAHIINENDLPLEVTYEETQFLIEYIKVLINKTYRAKQNDEKLEKEISKYKINRNKK